MPQPVKGKTRDKVSAAVGMSGKTYEKAKKIVANRSKALIAEMDEKSVEKAYKLLAAPDAQGTRRLRPTAQGGTQRGSPTTGSLMPAACACRSSSS